MKKLRVQIHIQKQLGLISFLTSLVGVFIPILSHADVGASCNSIAGATNASGEYIGGDNLTTCQCPAGYHLKPVAGSSDQVCRPSMGTDFIQNTSYSSYPYCGPHRVPVSSDYRVGDIATSFLPASSKKVLGYSGYNYDYAYGAQGEPKYLYSENASQCSCASKTYENSAFSDTHTTVYSDKTATGQARFVTDRYDTIAAQTSSNPQTYGPVAIAFDNISNGRAGDKFGQQLSACGCPNFNEKQTAIESNDSIPTGAICSSIISGDHKNFAVLSAFNKNLHDNGAASIVANRDSEPKVIGKTDTLVTKVLLPTNGGGLRSYSRKIWTCADPLTLVKTPTGAECRFIANKHSCDMATSVTSSSTDQNTGANAQTTVGGQDSAVSSNIPGKTLKDRFKNTLNRKLACCSNDMNSSDTYLKFDCIDNSTGVYHDVNDLWASSDQGTDGGNTNAIVLTGGQGNPVTGFYTIDGNRCNEYSEFGGEIAPAIISATGDTVSGGKESLKLPKGTGVSAMSGGLHVPKDKERARCPILVRAAIKVFCPATKGLPPALQTNFNDGTSTRCSSADTVQIHLRIEQVWQIEGTARVTTVDSIVDHRSMGTVRISDLLSVKNGTTCPPGTTREYGSPNCSY